MSSGSEVISVTLVPYTSFVKPIEDRLTIVDVLIEI